MSKVVAKTFFGTTAMAELGDDGYWKVTCDIQEALAHEGAEWDSRCISVMAIDKDRDKAYVTASNAVNSKFEALNFNLFQLPLAESSSGNRNPVKDYKTPDTESDSN